VNIRLIAEGEEEACNKFHNRLYKTNRTIDQWRWEFTLNNYLSKPVPYAVVEDDGAIVGTQAFIPIRLIDKDGVYWTAKSEETLVDPSYRGKKLFEKMYALLFEYAEEHEFSYIWGFTPAIKAFDRLNFTIPGKTGQIFMPFSARSIAPMMAKSTIGKQAGFGDKLKSVLARSGCVVAQSVSAVKVALNKNKNIGDLEIRTMDQPDEQTGELCRGFIDHYGGTTIYRDADYLKWRLFDNPYVKSVVRAVYDNDKLLGWVAFMLADDGLGYLVDIMTTPDDQIYKPEDLIRLLLLEAVIGSRNMGATGIRGWFVNKHPFDKLVRRTAREIGFYTFDRGNSVVLYNCSKGKERTAYDKFDDWYVSRIYTEGVLG